MFTWNKEADNVFHGIWLLAIGGFIALLIIIVTAVSYTSYYAYKYFKGDLIVKMKEE